MRSPADPITYLSQQTASAVIHILRITVGVTVYYFAESPVRIAGHDYLPYLSIEQGPRFTRSITGRTCRIALNNVDLTIQAVIKAKRDTLQGSSAVLAQWWLEAETEFVIFRGECGQVEGDQPRYAITLNGIDLNTQQVPKRLYSNLCPWKFKGTECGYAGGLTTCDKSFAACTTRARTFRFGGQIQLTRTLTDVVEGASGGNVLPGGGGGGGDEPRDRLFDGEN